MESNSYLPRVADAELSRRLSGSGAVVIEGPKACGKTVTARRVAASEVLLDVDDNARRAASVDASLILPGATPRLIDEWQLEPSIWNRIRREIDDRGTRGQFILTGSAVPADDITRHSGAGRISRLRMRPMSLLEAGLSTGNVAVNDLLEGRVVESPETNLSAGDIAELVTVGGWPGLLNLPIADGVMAVRDYLEEIRRTDVVNVDGRRRDPDRVGRLLRSLARNVASEAAASTLGADIGGSDGPLDPDTTRDYLLALHRLMIVEDQPAWSPHLRSRYTLRKAPKRHFVDPSLAAAALRATPDSLLQDLKMLGFLFESLVVRDLRVYAQAVDAEVRHYRDSSGLGVDAVVQAADRRWFACEVKLSASRIDEAAASLLKFAKKIDAAKTGEPGALVVVVPSGYGYVRDDGVVVVPIGALGVR